MKVVFKKIEFKDILNCFSNKREHKYKYLGITWNLFKEGTEGYELIEEFIQYVDNISKPKWCPRFILRILHLYGNDNSIIRCRSQKLSRISRKLLKGIMITDIKEKWGTLRIYGYFTKEINDKLRILESKINPMLEPY